MENLRQSIAGGVFNSPQLNRYDTIFQDLTTRTETALLNAKQSAQTAYEITQSWSSQNMPGVISSLFRVMTLSPPELADNYEAYKVYNEAT